jgi:hypothetical protein
LTWWEDAPAIIIHNKNTALKTAKNAHLGLVNKTANVI